MAWIKKKGANQRGNPVIAWFNMSMPFAVEHEMGPGSKQTIHLQVSPSGPTLSFDRDEIEIVDEPLDEAPSPIFTAVGGGREPKVN